MSATVQPNAVGATAVDRGSSAPAGRRLRTFVRGNLWLLLVVLGFLGPMLFLSWYAFDLQRSTVTQSLRLEIEQMARVLAQSMSDPIWNLIPASGRPAVQSLMEDERVVAVTVTSLAQGEFLTARDYAKRRGESIVLHRPVLHDGVEVGSVAVEVDVTHLNAKLLNQWDDMILILLFQVTMGLTAAILVIRVFGRLERQDALKDANLNLTREVERHRTTERELLIAKTSAEAASHAKTRFLHNMSHELRTPLNAVIGFSDIISNQHMGPVGQPRYVDYARDIHSAANHLLTIIDDILDIARLEGGNPRLKEERVDICELIDSCRRLVEPELTGKQQSVAMDFAAPMPMLYADRRHLKQIILNLLSNSIKYTPENGRIRIDAFVDGQGRISLRVADNGIGMAEAEIGVALDPFGQVNADYTLSQGGVGLGLPIVKALAEQHGAGFWIESEKGVGTTVTMVFPADRTVSPPGAGESAVG